MNVTRAQLTARLTARPRPRRERDVQAAILTWLNLQPGTMAWRNNVGAVKTGNRFVRFGFPGLPDIIGWCRHEIADGIYAAVFVAIEVKSASGRLRPHQAGFKALARRDGVLYIEARSVDDVIAGLK